MSGAVLPEGPLEWQELVAARSALLEVCDHSEGRDLPPEVISFLRWCAGVCDGRFLFPVF